MPAIDTVNKKILNNIQIDFPITSRPYKIIAEKLGLLEDELIQRITTMKKEMLIRRIGGNFSPDKLGYTSTLCAAQVPENKIKLFTTTVNSYSGVTHNYQREHKFNNLPATNVFKISANFKL